MDEDKSDEMVVSSSVSLNSDVDSAKSDSVIEATSEDTEMENTEKAPNPSTGIEDKTNSTSMPERVVIIDAGTRLIRIGVLGMENPKVFPNVVGKRKKTLKSLFMMDLQDTFFGEEAEKKMKICDMSYPFQNGQIAQLDALAEILNHAFKELPHLNVSEYKVLMKAEKEDRDKLLDVLFKTYNPQAILLANQASLSLFAVGCSTGLVVNIGEGTSQIVPIIENSIVQNAAVENLGCSGRILTEELRVMLNIDDTPAGHKRSREIKEEYCYVASDPEREEDFLSKQVELPDGQQIQIKSEQYQCPEVLFEKFRIHEVIVKAIKNCAVDKQGELYKNIVLAGGSTMLNGFPERLEKEIKALVADGTEIKIIAPSDRMNLAWKGGLKIASENLFSNSWITRDDFKENEAELIQSKYI